MITGERMAAVDANAAALGVSRLQLMESSGHAIARVVRAVSEPGERVALIAGRGNNGGDAFVAARFLDDRDPVTILLGHPDRIATDIAATNWATLEATDHDTSVVTNASDFELPDVSVVVDAMLGTGASGELREPVATAAQSITDCAATVVSVDVPTGLDATTGERVEGTVVPDHVVTFHDTKPGLEALDADVTVADIGIPAAATRRVGPGDRERIVTTARSARVYVVGGGPYAGAPALTAQAALRAGAELSFVAVPDAVSESVQGYEPDLIVQPYEGATLAEAPVAALVDTATRYDDVVVLGPGLGSDPETLSAARSFLESFDGLAVVDADALQVVPEAETAATLVCTPNPAELEAMGGPAVSDPRVAIEAIEELATALECVILAKGPTDVITDGDRTRTNPRGTPGMAVGGTGDVLAGVVAAVLEATDDTLEAAAVGAYVAAIAGEACSTERGSGFTASDQLAAVPASLWGERA